MALQPHMQFMLGVCSWPVSTFFSGRRPDVENRVLVISFVTSVFFTDIEPALSRRIAGRRRTDLRSVFIVDIWVL